MTFNWREQPLIRRAMFFAATVVPVLAAVGLVVLPVHELLAERDAAINRDVQMLARLTAIAVYKPKLPPTAGLADTWALACDTDGIDGSEDNAGAVMTPDSLARARALGMDARRLLAENDGYGFFAALGDLVTTGPTRTNVNDYRVILVR